MLETVEQRYALLASIERMRNSAMLTCVLHDNAMLADDVFLQLYDKLQALGKRDRLDLFLYARNGLIEVSWRALSLLREYCDTLGVIVATRVQSAATLLALGADEIIMGPISELGGIEPVTRHPLLRRDDTGQPIIVSFGEIKSLLRFLSEYGGGAAPAEVQSSEVREIIGSEHPQLTPELLAALFQHIPPLVIGNLEQANTLCRDVTEKALRMHFGAKEMEKVERLVNLFNGGFHSPNYTATRAELKQEGLNVVEPDKELWTAIWGLVQLYQSALNIERPENTAPGAFFRHVCILETAGRSTGLRQTFTQVEGQERVISIGWESVMRGPGPGPVFGPGGRSNN